MDVAQLGDDVWQGVRNQYWHFETYFLPIVTWREPDLAAAAAATSSAAME